MPKTLMSMRYVIHVSGCQFGLNVVNAKCSASDVKPCCTCGFAVMYWSSSLLRKVCVAACAEMIAIRTTSAAQTQISMPLRGEELLVVIDIRRTRREVHRVGELRVGLIVVDLRRRPHLGQREVGVILRSVHERDVDMRLG